METKNRNQKAIDFMTRAVSFLVQNPDLPQCSLYEHRGTIYFYNGALKPDEVVRLFGTMTKYYDEYSFKLTKDIGDLKLEFEWSRSTVCKKVKTGTKVIPASPEQVIPATEARIEDVYEWECPDSILRPHEEVKPEEDVLQSASDAVEEANLPATAPHQTEAISDV